MKKRILTLCCVIVVIVGAGAFVLDYMSYSTVALTLSNNVKNAEVINQAGEIVKTVNSSEDIRLKNGAYEIKPRGEIISEEPIAFKVESKDTTLAIDPDYSVAHLAQLLDKEQSVIRSTILEKYPNSPNDFVINEGALFSKGEWYGTTFTAIVGNSGDSGDIYRLVLKKDDSGWKIIDRPRLVMMKEYSRDTPTNVLEKINMLKGDIDSAFRTQRIVPTNPKNYESRG